MEEVGKKFSKVNVGNVSYVLKSCMHTDTSVNLMPRKQGLIFS
jgi:hypothetical protein